MTLLFWQALARAPGFCGSYGGLRFQSLASALCCAVQVNAGVQYLDYLFVGNVHIVTPYHKLLDFLLSATNASTLKGMAPVHASKVTKRGIRLDHLFNSRAVCVKRLGLHSL